jgi:DNA helicase-2/ATP-dependent DNA helicase PcrA
MKDITEAVLNSSSTRLCVIAGPGCRKTTGILIPKAKQVLGDATIDPKHVLLLTFSRLGALDLKSKVKEIDRAPKASTVHSFCLSFLLSENNHSIRKRVGSIILDFEKEVLLSDLAAMFAGQHKKDLRKKLKQFSAGWATQQHDEVFEQNDEQRSFKNAVVHWLEEHEAAMMEEIIYFAVDLARQLPDAKALAEPQFIFVDEFQDLNKLEQEFIHQLAAKSALLLVVGDPDQSIYSFKYAHPLGISEFGARKGVETHRSVVTWRCPKRFVKIANQLLLQADPQRKDLLITPADAADGEMHFVRKDYQAQEFDYVLRRVAERLRESAPNKILVLVPKKKLGVEFAAYAEASRQQVGIQESTHCRFAAKYDFNESEKESILRLSLLNNPNSVVHRRSLLGLGDDSYFAAEIRALKEKYGSLQNALDKASAEDFPRTKKRIRSVCQKISDLKNFLRGHADASLDVVIDELFPDGNAEVAETRKILKALQEESDTVSSLYDKFVDYVRTVPEDDNTVRVMTLGGSKGLDADHVFILGCNAGNLPGERRSEHITDAEHKDEQRRLLFVGFTRAKKSLTVSWSRRIPFSQSKGHHTHGVRTVRYDGKTYIEVGLSDFLQDLRVQWEQ